MKVIIAGSRYFNDYALLKEKCDYYLKNQKNVEIVSGCANGADKLGEYYAWCNSLTLYKFPADFKNLGLSAGPKRNKQMAEFADALILFYDGKSKGSTNMLKQAQKYGLKIRIVMIPEDNIN